MAVLIVSSLFMLLLFLFMAHWTLRPNATLTGRVRLPRSVARVTGLYHLKRKKSEEVAWGLCISRK